MAQVKEPYGLVYNTDGSLCVTYRDDDIPFAGVRSFAVEAPTTNLVNVYTLQSQSGSYITSTIENVDTPFGKKDVVKIIKSGSGDRFRFKNLYYPTLDEEVAITLFVKPINGLSKVIIAQNHGTRKDYNFSTGGGYIKDGWHKITHKFVSGNTNKIELWLDAYSYTPEGNEGCYVISQVESGKRYFTSYVDESRPKAEMYIEANDIKADENRLKNHVISFWFKVQESYDEEYNTIQDYSNWMIVGTRRGSMWGSSVPTGWQLGILNSSNALREAEGKLIFVYRREDNPYAYPLVNKGTYENQWNHIVITKYEENDIEEMKVYLNGKLKGTWTSGDCANRYSGVVENILFCNGNGTNARDKQRSHLLSNIYIGKYKRPDGTIIWTNDYIREVYEAKIPFPVSNKLSIY